MNKKRKEKNITKKLDKEEEIESLTNPILITIILFGTLIFTTFFMQFSPIIPFPLDLITIIWYSLFLIVFYFICRKEKRTYKGLPYEVKDEKDLSLKYEIIRKTTHGVIFGIAICYMFLGPVFMEMINFFLNHFPLFGINKVEVPPSLYGHYTVVFFTVIAFLGLATSEVVRIFFYKAYPLKGVKAIFRRKETGAALGSHIALAVGSMAVILVFGGYWPEIVMASISISAIGDAAANLVGKRFGKHSYKGVISRKRKTFEGLLTATIVSFSLSFLFLIYRYGLYSFFLAFIATLVMAIIDWLSPNVSDNLLNPIATSIVMVFFVYILPLNVLLSI
ncbi:MAG: diacylglycerol/polyprenol kinase family protein [Candidatus Hodarchaeota archaeon]